MAIPRQTFIEQLWHAQAELTPSSTKYAFYQNGYNATSAAERNTPLRYTMYVVRSPKAMTRKSDSLRFAFDANDFTRFFSDIASTYPRAYNQAYNRLKGKLMGDTADVGMLFAEWGESWRMMVNRLDKLRRAAAALSRGNFRKFYRELGTKAKRWRRLKAGEKTKRAAKSLADIWLENSFGWSPLFGTIQDTFDALSDPRAKVSRHRAGSQDFRYKSGRVTDWDFTSAARIRITLGATAEIDNPNAFLANRLGITNIGTIAVELIPFSFVADWLFDINTFIGSFTDWVGVKRSKQWCFCKVEGSIEYVPFRNYTGSQVVNVVRCRRSTGEGSHPRPYPNLEIVRNQDIKRWKTRAGNAAALLTQLYNGLDRAPAWIQY